MKPRDVPAIRIGGGVLAQVVADVRVLARFVRRRYGLEPRISIAPATARSALCVVTISYDRKTRGQEREAARCYRSFAEQLLARGYALYRLTSAPKDLDPRGEYTCLLGL